MLKPLLIAILALAVVAAVVFVGGKYLVKETLDETVNWGSYTYPSTESGILPNITFRYPPVFRNVSPFISSRKTNPPQIVSPEWGGFIQFGTLDSGLRIEFLKLDKSKNNLEELSKAPIDREVKVLQVDGNKAIGLRFKSPTHYDADVGWYFVELPEYILQISTSGGGVSLYDDNQRGYSTRDKIISTFKFIQ